MSMNEKHGSRPNLHNHINNCIFAIKNLFAYLFYRIEREISDMEGKHIDRCIDLHATKAKCKKENHNLQATF